MVETLFADADSESRLKFKASDVRAIPDAGILDDDLRYKLIDGEIIP